MTALLLLSIALLGLGIAWSAQILRRSQETRVGVLTAALGCLAARQAFALWSQWGAPLGFDAATAAELASLGASAVALWIVAALARTLQERDQTEAIHWDSMEVVRVIGDLAANPSIDPDEKLASLLALGCTRFRLEVGIVARVRRDRYEVRAIHAPEGFPVVRGSVLPLSETCCRSAFGAERPVAIERVGESSLAPPARDAFGFQSYLGAPIRVAGEPVGTLCFGSPERRRERFTATDKDLIKLMAQWIGWEMERAAHRAPDDRLSGAPRGRPASRRARAAAAGADVNAVVGRIERRLRALLPASVELEIVLQPDLARAAAQGLPLEAVIRSLVRNACDAMPDGGRLTLRSADVELGGGEPGVVAAVAPDRYVTLSVSDTGGGAGADALPQLFSPAAEPGEPGGEDGALALPAIYRLLQRRGGDLSVDVEPGRGTTFTVFLPRAERAAARRRPRERGDAPRPGITPS